MATLAQLKALITVDGAEVAQAKIRQTGEAMRDAAKTGNGAFDGIGRSLQNVGRSMSLWGAGLSATVTAPLLLIGRSAIGMSAEFEQSMNVLKLTANASDAQLRQLSQTAIKLGSDTSLPATSSLDAAQAMLELSKAGLSVNDTMAATRGTLQLAAAAGMSAGDAAKIVAASLSSFNLPGKEATRVADMLASAAVAAQGEISDMGTALQQSSAVAKLAGQSIGDTVTAIGLMANDVHAPDGSHQGSRR
jgi:TP901 family phage tail tape measure protein